MSGLGLFQVLFLRVLGLIAAALLLMIALTHLYQGRHLTEAWRADLQQEAEWTARHFADAATGERHSDPAAGRDLGSAWRDMHESVRLVIRDAEGRVLVDSHPAWPLAGGRLLVGRAVVERPSGDVELTLSRPAPFPFPANANLELLVVGFIVIVLAAAALYPWTRNLTRTFGNLASQARQVAAGEFGMPLPLGGGRELDALVVSFNAMSQRLKEEEARRRRLIADVSHELRSPMGRLRALAETLARHPEEATPILSKMDDEVSLMDRLVGDMLETARLDEGRGGIALQRISTGEWARECFERLRMRVEREGIAFQTGVTEPNATALLDPQRLMQALGNLIDNAVAATVGREDAKITAALDATANEWAITVSDNGRGVSRAQMPLLFDRFFRVQPDRGRATGGAGLGLSIAKAIVEAHGGRIEVESELGHGTSVRMVFPRSEV